MKLNLLRRLVGVGVTHLRKDLRVTTTGCMRCQGAERNHSISTHGNGHSTEREMTEPEKLALRNIRVRNTSPSPASSA